MSMTLVGTYAISTPGNLVLSSIPQTGTDLLILFSGREQATTAGGLTDVSIFVENTSSGVYKVLRGNGTAASSVATNIVGSVPNSLATSNTFGNMAIYIPNYTNTTSPRVVTVESVSEQNATAGGQHFVAQRYSNGGAVSFVTMIGTSGFAVGSMASVYLITKGSSGGVVVS